MNPNNRIAKTVVWLVAAGFMVVGLLNFGLEWYKCHRNHVNMSFGNCIYPSIPILIGIVILIKSSALAEWIDQYLDD